MNISPPSFISLTSDPPLSSESSDWKDRLTAAASSISFGVDQGITRLGQDPSLSELMGDGMVPPII